MSGWLRRLFGRGSRGPSTAPLNEFLLLVAGRTRAGGRTRASGRIGAVDVSVQELSAGEGGPAEVPLEALLDAVVPRLTPDQLPELFDFVFAAVEADLDKPGAISLGKSLRVLRDRLRHPLPDLVAAPTASPVLTVDGILAVDDRSFWIVGWCIDEDGVLGDAQLFSPEGQRVAPLREAHRFTRPDVVSALAEVGIRTTDKHGFCRFVQLEHPSLLNEGWLGELRSPTGAGFQIGGPPVTRDPVAVRERILWQLSGDEPGLEELRRDHVSPALRRLQSNLASTIEVETEIQHGEAPPDPDVSIIVPLYERMDLLEHQIVQLWQDPEVNAAELIYVLDSPERAETTGRLAAMLHELYGIPFRFVKLNRNAGYSTANNIGASLARGRLLLLLNSDVLPVRPGWLGRMQAFYDATPQIGALGPKLLYEDDSLQHAGMYFKRDAETGNWENQHYYKGFSRWLPAANLTRPVPAVTGACMMVASELYHELGGLQNVYVQGGYEDSDLCLRLVQAGRRNWYIADVELFHLEAQSFPVHVRLANRYNAWLQTHQWDRQIEELMQQSSPAANGNVVAVG